MARIRVDRRIGADPSGTALVLAGPAAVELWPGAAAATRDGHPVRADGRCRRAGGITVLPPRRTPTAYVTELVVAVAGLPTTTGVLTLRYAGDAAGRRSTCAELVLDTRYEAPAAGALRQAGAGFLANLARVAEARSHAA